jgi:hypothetical protein
MVGAPTDRKSIDARREVCSIILTKSGSARSHLSECSQYCMPIVSAVVDRHTTYPDVGDLSPSESYPEYAFEVLSPRPNSVYRAVRDCLAQAGLDAEHFGTPAWNPFGRWVHPGQRVFVLCNFVQHRRANETGEDFAGKCAHGSVLRPLIDYLLIALRGEGQVVFGNAPLQSCDWSAVLADTQADNVADFYQTHGQPVEARDLRLFVTERNVLGAIKSLQRRDESAGCVIDLASQSMLAKVANPDRARFRLLDYDPRRIEAHHWQGNHKYVVHRSVLEADVIVSLPTLKTHEKVGITCALKGCVGAIAHKDCLAHHRVGTPATGGDEYPNDRLRVKRMISRFHDWAQQTVPGSAHGNLLRVVDKLLRVGLHRVVHFGHGGWWGNDTAWRMALDIARILRFADTNGKMQTTPQRQHLVLVDGIVGGQGDGPLKPTAAHRGIVLFADDLPVADYACATMMGFDAARIPLVRESFGINDFPLTDSEFGEGDVVCHGERRQLTALAEIVGEPFDAPPGWRGTIERQPGSLVTNGAAVS